MPNSLYAPAVLASLSQGDILRNVRVAEPHIKAGDRTFDVMVLTHGCEIDKQTNKVMLVAAVRPVSDFPQDQRDKIRQGEKLALFYLPAEPPAFTDERCVDFRMIYRVAFDAVRATSFGQIGGDIQRVLTDPTRRVQSLSEEGLNVLAARLIAFFVRNRDYEEFLQNKYSSQ